MSKKHCPCGNKRSYEKCCQQFHLGKKCTTTEELLRARFSAFVREQKTFLVDTHHPMHLSAQLISDLEDSAFEPFDLVIDSKAAGEKGDVEGAISYSFSYLGDGKNESFATTSLYSKLGGDWYYEKDL